jgi:hypothetical protein
VYLCFLTRHYYWDGLSFAIDIERVLDWRELLSVHHLLYNFIGYTEHRLLGRSIRSLYLMQATNAVAGGAMIWLVYRLMRSLDVCRANSAACAAILATAATFWKFATDADSYILANVFLVAAFLMIPRAPLWGALLHVCAIMTHQLSALFFPVALALLWRARKDRFRSEALAYTAVSASLTLTMYGIAYRLAPYKLANTFIGWLTYHSEIPFVFKAGSNTGWLLLGTARLFVGGRLVPIAYIVGPISLAVFLWAAARLVRGRVEFQPVGAAWPLLVWVGVYVVFLFVWEPYNTFYRIFYVAPLVALLAVTTRAMPARPLAAIAVALLLWNFFLFIYPNTRVENNGLLSYALEQRKQWPPGTGIIFSKLVPDLWTIAYFNPQVSWIPLEQPDPARVAEYARQFGRNGGKLYLDLTYRERAGMPANGSRFELVRLR